MKQQRPLKLFDPRFWELYADASASEFVRFLALAEAGEPLPAMPQVARDAAARKLREDLDVNVASLRELLIGLG